MTIEDINDIDDIETQVSEEPPETEAEEPAARSRRWSTLALLVAATLVMITGLFAWWQSSGDEDTALAETRDTVLISARQHIQTLNSLDYRSVDKGLKTWLAVTTGTLHDQLAAVGADERQLLADQKKISTGRVVDAAVLDLDDGKATVIASVEITVVDDAVADAQPTVKRNRFTADLVDVKGSWKLENLQQVAVNLS